MNLAAHVRYDSDEFDYSGCVTCDTNGDTLGWPCPTVQRDEIVALLREGGWDGTDVVAGVKGLIQWAEHLREKAN